ncbi:MAG: hypothetical protein AAFQ07_19400 [Chloroflexota bacterium]
MNAPSALVRASVEIATANASNDALRAVQRTPRPSVHPFRWSLDSNANARARRWYFAAVARGEIRTDGTRYVRSGDLGKSFDVFVEERSNSIDAVFGSDFDKASYVTGNADGSVSQIPGHARTGWFEFNEPAQQFVTDVVAGVQRELPNQFEKAVGT